MNDHEASRAEQDVIATTDSYGGPVSEQELAEVYLAPQVADEASTKFGKDQPEVASAGRTQDGTPPDVTSDPAKTDQSGTDWTDEGGATPDGAASEVSSA